MRGVRGLVLVGGVVVACAMALMKFDGVAAAWANADARQNARGAFAGELRELGANGRVMMVGRDTPRKSRPPLAILLAGWGLPDPTAYYGLIRALVGADYRVVFPQFQTTSWPHGAVFDEVRGLLDEAIPDWRERTQLIIGHSAGAPTAIDLVVAEGRQLKTRAVFLACAGDGPYAGPEPPPWPLRLPWGAARPDREELPSPRPRVVILSGATDELMGRWVSDRLGAYLRTLDPEWPIAEEVVTSSTGGCDNHFWPLGGYPLYRLPLWFRAPFGNCAPDWPVDDVDRNFWRRIVSVGEPSAISSREG